MKISQRESKDRESIIFTLFFLFKFKQYKISKILWVSERTVRRYVKRRKKV